MKGIKAETLALIIVLSILIPTAIIRPFIPWDSWAFHFPFSDKLLDISGGEYYQLCGAILDRYHGFPLLGNILQGILWKYSGYIGFTVVVNFIGLAFYIYAAKIYSQIPALPFFLAIFAIPILGINFFSTYLDFFSATSAAALFLILFHLLDEANQTRRNYFLAILLTIICAGTKYSSIMAGIAIVITFSTHYLASNWKRLELRKLAFFAFLFAIANAWFLRNFILHHNPVYPLELHIFSVHFSGPEIEYRNYPGYFDRLDLNLKPLNFILSITEIDWTLRVVNYLYTIDSGHGDSHLNFNPARTGGFGVLYIGIVFLYLSYLLTNIRNISSKTKNFLIIFGLLATIVSFFPQSHELRYWMFLPLIVNVIILENFYRNNQKKTFYATLAMMVFLAVPLIARELIPHGKTYFRKAAAANTPVEIRYIDNTTPFEHSYIVTGENVRYICPEERQHTPHLTP